MKWRQGWEGGSRFGLSLLWIEVSGSFEDERKKSRTISGTDDVERNHVRRLLTLTNGVR